MKPRPSQPIHSIGRSFAIGATIAAFAIVVFIMLGGGRP